VKKNATSILIALAMAAGVSTLSAQTLLWSDTTFVLGPDPAGWNTAGFRGILDNTGGQLTVTENFFGRADTNNIFATHVPAVHTVPGSGPLRDGQTLELRADLISASQKDAYANLVFEYVIGGQGNGYTFNKGGDGLSLAKFYGGVSAMKFAYFFFSNQPVKNENVTLVLALTRTGTNLNITTRVLDKDTGNAVRFDYTVIDTPKADPVLPPYTAGGMIGMADLAGTPWPLLMGPTWIQASLTWADPLLAPNPRAKVVFDNVELWQYETPRLTIADAVVLSWPVTATQFVLESAPGMQGPWEVVSAPWSRTNATQIEVSVPAPDSMRLFRLKYAP
jgi:hypothetical protein